jgi:hypothetical protein
MRPTARGSARSLCALILTGAMLLNACSSWHPVSGSVPSAIEGTRAEVFRVDLRDGRVLHVHDAHVVNDSLMGTERHPIRARTATPDERARGYTESVVKVPVADVASIEVSRRDRGRTALAVIAGVGIAFVVVALIGFAATDLSPGGSSY